jgi:DUF1009 family protein
MPEGRLGILALGGPLPVRAIETCRERGRDFLVVAYRNITDPATVEGTDHVWVRLGAAATWVGLLKKRGVRDLVPVGAIRRPGVFELMPDWMGLRVLMRVGFNRAGDDAVMRGLVRELEREGFRVLPAQDVLPGLVAAPGLLTAKGPDDVAADDIRRGFEAARTIGALDVGQAAVVQQAVVLALEAAEGTDQMLARCKALARPGPGGVLVKAKKPQQDPHIDPPAIGVATVRNAAAAGLRGIAVEAGVAWIVDPEAVAREADRLGLFVLATEDPAG